MAPEAHADGADLASMRAMRPPTHALQRLASDLERLCSTAELRRRFPPRVMAEFILALASGATLESAANPAALPFEVLSQMVVSALGFTDLEDTLPREIADFVGCEMARERGPHAVGMQRAASGVPTKPASWVDRPQRSGWAFRPHLSLRVTGGVPSQGPWPPRRPTPAGRAVAGPARSGSRRSARGARSRGGGPGRWEPSPTPRRRPGRG